jgi:hypothetical protein
VFLLAKKIPGGRFRNFSLFSHCEHENHFQYKSSLTMVNVTVITIATILVGIVSVGGKMHGSATVCVQTKGGEMTAARRHQHQKPTRDCVD